MSAEELRYINSLTSDLELGARERIMTDERIENPGPSHTTWQKVITIEQALVECTAE